MKFYDLTKPKYSTDQEDLRLNPINSLNGVKLPAVICDKCVERIGGQWTSSNRIHVSKSKEEQVKEFLNRNKIDKVVHVDNWLEIKKELAAFLEIKEEYIQPGSQVGLPRGEVFKHEIEDIVHPFPGLIWIRDEVKKTLKKHGVTGIDFVKVNIVNNITKSDLELWELDIRGMAWRIGMSFEKILDCDKCKRTIFPEPNMLKVDETKWDRSDIFNVDLNPNIVIVTEKVCKILSENHFTNYQCTPI